MYTMWTGRGINKSCIFECLPAIQTWALAKVPSNPYLFSSKLFFTNMDYLYWRVTYPEDNHHIARILWYIWK